MARREYGGTLEAFTTTSAGIIRGGLDVYTWTARTGGTRINDLQAVTGSIVGGGSIGDVHLLTGPDASIDFLGPDGYSADGIWVSADPSPSAPRLWLRAQDITGSGGGGPVDVPDASSTVKGLVRLAGDLGGTADAPVVTKTYAKGDLGLGLVDNVPATALRDRSTHTGTQPATSITGLATVATTGTYADLSGRPDLTGYLTTSAAASTYTPLSEVFERAQDAAAAMFRAGTNVTFTYDDAANTFTINASGGGAGSTDPEVVRDTIGGALVGGANIQITVNDPADTITIAVTGLATVATSGSYADLTNKPTIPTVGAAGAGAGVALSSTDASVTNARTPTAHASTHAAGGSDLVSPASIGAENAGAASAAQNYSVQRANHTGTQPATSITGLAAVATSGSRADVGLGNVANLSPTGLATSSELMDAFAPRVQVIDASITAATTLTPNRHHKVDVSAAGFTVTLPTPTVVGQRIRVEKVDSSANLVQITGTIRGATANDFLSYQFRTVEFFAESLTSWRPASDRITKAQLDAQYEIKIARTTATAGQVPVLQADGTLAFATVAGGGGAPQGTALGFPTSFDPINGTAAAAIGAANRTTYLRVMGAGTISKLAVEVTTSSGNIQLSVYRNSGTGAASVPGVRAATTGVVACPAAGYAEISLGGSATVAAGDWFAIGGDSGTVAFRSAITTLLTSAIYAGRGAYATDHPSPATAGAVTVGLNRPPLIIGIP